MKNVFRSLSAFLAGLLYTLLILISIVFSSSLAIAQDTTQLEMTTEEMNFKHQPNDIEVSDVVDTRQFKTLTSLNCRSNIGATAPLVTTIPANSIIDNKTEKVAWNSNDPSLSHVGIINNGLWMMVGYNNQQCFVRASKSYLTPVTQNGGGNHGYTPPPLSQDRLGTISLDQATVVQANFEGLRKALKLPEDQLYIDADLDVDADGSPRAKKIDPCCGQLETSFSVSGQAVNAEKVPYFVLPGNNPRLQDRFYYQMGLEKGDIAVVIYKDKVEYAIFADVGPTDKIGEGSIFLKRSLLNQTPTDTSGLSVEQVKQITSSGIDKDVIYIAFPNSKPSGLTSANLVEKVRVKGQELFLQIGGKTD